MLTNSLKKISYANFVCYCTKAEKKLSYSNTLFLPKTKFPLRLTNKKLVERDEQIYSVRNCLIVELKQGLICL